VGLDTIIVLPSSLRVIEPCGAVAISAALTPPTGTGSVAGFKFEPPVSTYTLFSRDSLCNSTLNRSRSSACSISGTCDLVAPSGIFAKMSQWSFAIHAGAET